MNREQAQAILQNLDLIRHFAEGGDIGHRVINYKGTQLRISTSKSILLCNLRPNDQSLYVKVRPRLVFRGGVLVRRQRCFTETIRDSEVIE